MRLAGARAVITGGASGIGAETARTFAREGAVVAILDVDVERGNALANELLRVGDAMFIRCDVTHEGDVADAFTQLLGGWPRLDVFVSNAGVAPPARTPFDELEPEAWDEILNELRGCYLTLRRAVGAMKTSGGGSIITVSSIGGMRGIPFRHAYSAAKAGMIGLTQSLALELAGDRIRVNCVAPGPVDTPLLRRGTDELSAERVDQLSAAIPLGRPGSPADVASAILYLASDEASWLTGVVLPIEGGMTAR